MVNVAIETDVIDILRKYINNDSELESIIGRISEQNLDFSIIYEKYDSAINIHIARLVIDYQETIYRIAALFLYDKPRAGLLSKDEKDRLELAFTVSSGCTNIFEKIGKFLERILPMIPEKQRGMFAVAIILIFFGYMSFTKFLDYKESTKSVETIANLQTTAIEKMAETNKDLVKIILNAEKENINTLSKVDATVQINEQEYTSEQLQEIKSKKFPRKTDEKTVSTMKGIFHISNIKLADGSIVVENEKEGKITILYDTADDNLLNYISDIKSHLKKAVDNEKKLFEISATVVKKGNTVESRTLQTIKEYNKSDFK